MVLSHLFVWRLDRNRRRLIVGLLCSTIGRVQQRSHLILARPLLVSLFHFRFPFQSHSHLQSHSKSSNCGPSNWINVISHFQFYLSVSDWNSGCPYKERISKGAKRDCTQKWSCKSKYALLFCALLYRQPAINAQPLFSLPFPPLYLDF